MKRLSIVCCLPLLALALPQLAHASVGFAGVKSFNVGTSPQSVAVGDFNDDGKPDVVVANFADNTVSVLLGNGDGTFQAQVTYAVGSSPYAVAVGDFNGDRIQDLAVANEGGNSVSILLGNGGGTFQTATSFAVGSNPYGIALADFNGDGLLDVVTGNFGSNNVSILLGKGNGSFQSAANYAAGSEPSSVAAADFNGDGKPDLVVTNQSAAVVSILLNNGTGGLGSRSAYNAGTTPVSVVVADFNNDGRADLAVANSSGVDVLLGNGNGTFQTATSFSADTSPEAVAAGDFNSDGNQDLVVANNGSNDVSILLGTGGGSFQNPVNYTVGWGPSAVAVADFKNTGQLDVAETNISNNTVDVLLGEGNGAFQVASSYAEPNGGEDYYVLALGDFNNDGKPDLAVTYESYLAILLGNGDGGFSAASYPPSGDDFNYGVATGDFNGDGRVDLAVSEYFNNSVGILLGNGDGTFQKPVLFSIGCNEPDAPGLVAVGDFNGDGKLDVAISDSCGTAVLLGNGDGTLQGAVNYAAGGGAIVVSDFNGDGKLDLAVGGAILFGNGDGTFQVTTNYTGGGFAAPDLNGDGKPDLATWAGSSVGVVLNNGDGTFGSLATYGSGTNPWAGASGDFNGDGRADVVTANYFGTTSVFFGNGDGTLQSPLNYVGGGESVVTADFNQDGALDLAFVSVDSYTLTVLLNTGGTFITITSSQNPSSFGQSVTFTATVTASIPGSGNPSGSVTFLDGSTVLGTVALSSGVAMFSTSTLSTGTHTITAMYSGDSNFNPHTGAPLTQTVTGQAPIVTLSPTSLTFGNQNLGTTSAAQNVTLTNTGTATLNITSIAASGDFAQTNNCGSSVAPSASCTISVTFTPTAVGTRTGAVTLTDNASNSPQTVSLTGTGVGIPIPKISPLSLAFGKQNVGTTSPPQPVTLTNTGMATLSISSIVASTNFGQTNNCGSSLLAGASCTINVTFTPTAAGTLTGTVTFTDNASNSPQVVRLTGTGVGVPAVKLSPGSLSFSTQLVGTSGVSKPVTLTNTGTGTLSITSITFTGADPTDFSQTNTCGSSVAAGANCTINVSFKPTAKGSRTVSVSITDNAAGSPQKVSLTGTGTVVKLSPTSLNFGSVQVGHNSAAKSVTVTNTGSSSLSVTNIGITGTNAGDFSETNTCGSSLGGGKSCSISVTFTPRAKGNRTASLSITDNGGGSPQPVSLSGTGT